MSDLGLAVYAVPMNSSACQVLDQYSGYSDVSVCDSGAARVFEAKRSGLIVRVTVPFEVLEWYVDVLDGTAVVVQEWLDYEGYDDTPSEELAVSMGSDIEGFLVKLLNRDIRLVSGKRSRIEDFASKLFNRDIKLSRTRSMLEWKVDESWEQALPFFIASA